MTIPALKSSASPTGAFAVTPNDGADLPRPVRGLSVAGDGTVVIDDLEGNTAVSLYLVAGAIFPQRCRRVRATGTTATGIVGHYGA